MRHLRRAVFAALLVGCAALDVPSAPVVDAQAAEVKPNALLRKVRSALLPFVQAPPITRSWVSA